MGIFSSIINTAGNVMNNSANIIAQDRWNQQSMDFQREMWKKNSEYDTQQWNDRFNKMNEYNSAKSQVARFKDAGLNPAMMMNGQGAGTATSASVGSPQATPPAGQAPKSQWNNPMNFDDTDVLNARDNMRRVKAEADKAEEEARGIQIDNDYARDMKMQELENLKRDANDKVSQTYYRNQQAFLLMQQSNDLIKKAKFDADYSESMAKSAAAKSVIDEFEAKNYPTTYKERMANLISDTANKVVTGELTRQQAITEIYKQGQMFANEVKTQWETQFIMDTFNDAVRKAKAEADKASKNTGYENATQMLNGLWTTGKDRWKNAGPWEKAGYVLGGAALFPGAGSLLKFGGSALKFGAHGVKAAWKWRKRGDSAKKTMDAWNKLGL